MAEPFDFDQANRLLGVEGLRELRLACAAMSPQARRAMSRAIREAARVISNRAQTLAPRQSGDLARSIKPGVDRDGAAVVRSRLPYAGVQEWGGTIRPRGVPIEIARNRFLGRAIHEEFDTFADELGDQIDRLAARNGWT